MTKLTALTARFCTWRNNSINGCRLYAYSRSISRFDFYNFVCSPSEDDVDVLRKELVHAQTLMNTMTIERELEISKMNIQIEQLKLKCSEYDD